MKKEIVVISLGGSIVVPDEIDTKFLHKFRKLILNYIKKGHKVALVVGGGRTARKYINAVDKFKIKDIQKDWIGIMATRINAQLVKAIFNDHTHEKVIYDPTKRLNLKKQILVCAGYKPGWSTDYVATLLAKNLNANRLINLSNIYYVFDKDPKKFKDAKKLESMDWHQMQKIVGTKWIPGANLPFDPIATSLSKKMKLKVIISKGTDLVNLNKILNEKKAKATVIQ